MCTSHFNMWLMHVCVGLTVSGWSAPMRWCSSSFSSLNIFIYIFSVPLLGGSHATYRQASLSLSCFQFPPTQLVSRGDELISESRSKSAGWPKPITRHHCQHHHSKCCEPCKPIAKTERIYCFLVL